MFYVALLHTRMTVYLKALTSFTSSYQLCGTVEISELLSDWLRRTKFFIICTIVRTYARTSVRQREARWSRLWTLLQILRREINESHARKRFLSEWIQNSLKASQGHGNTIFVERVNPMSPGAIYTRGGTTDYGHPMKA